MVADYAGSGRSSVRSCFALLLDRVTELVIQNCAVFEIPSALAWMHGSPRASSWLRELPARVQRCARRWNLELAEPFPQSFVSVVFHATRRDGSGAVLKIQYPYQE